MNKEQLIEQFGAYKIPFDTQRVDLLMDFMNKTLETNQKFNLTAIENEDEFIEKMIFDSALVFSGHSLSNKSCIDIGTGAGYPGMVLKILDPSIQMTLLDSTKKKIDYLKQFADEKGIVINTFAGRAEDYARLNIEKFDYATARAVAGLPVLLELITPLLKVGGELIALKGAGFEKELQLSRSALKKLDMEIIKVKEFELPYSKEQRAIIHIRKNKKTAKKYPRDYSEIKRQPL